MAKGMSSSDWTAKWEGSSGTVVCPPYAGRFIVLRTGVTRLTWTSGPEPGPGHGEIQRAALKAADSVVFRGSTKGR